MNDRTVTELIRESIENKIFANDTKTMPNLSELRKDQWSPRFEMLMRNRLVMGAFRYGTLNRQIDDSLNRYDNVGSMTSRLRRYEEDQNLEHLIDVANLCLVEFVMAEAAGLLVVAQDDGEHAQLKSVT